MTAPVIVGILLQGAAAFAIRLSISDAPLRPRTFELVGALVLAPLAAFLFVWALRSAPNHGDAKPLATGGAYAWVRHPIYLAFLAMLVATGLVISSGLKLVAAVALYLAGSELRIASGRSGDDQEVSSRLCTISVAGALAISAGFTLSVYYNRIWSS